MIQERDDIVALDSAIIQHPRTWEASGHLAGFSDPLVQCLGKCKRRFREDHLREEAEAEGKDPDNLVCPDCGGELTEPRAFQPHVRDHDRPGAGGGLHRLPASRDRPGHLPRLQERSSSRARSRRSASPRSASPSATRSRPATSSSARSSSSRWRWSSSCRPAEAEQWHEYWMEAAHGLVRVARGRPGQAAAAPPRARRAVALQLGHERHRVPVPDRLVRAGGNRQPRRLRPQAARRALGRRSSSTSTPPPASATCRT